MSSALRPLTIGEILDGAFAIYRRNFPVLVGTSILLCSPMVAVQMVLDRALEGALGGEFPPPLLTSPVSILIEAFAYAAVIRQVSEAILGRRPTMGDGLRAALLRGLPVFAGMIATFFFCTIGFVLLLVPGLIILAGLFAVVPVIVIEGNAVTSIERSWGLSRGARLKILAVLFISGIITFIPSNVVGLATGYTFRAMKSSAYLPPDILTVLLGLLVHALVTPFGLGVWTLLYYDQRVRKEGLDVEVAAEALAGLAPPAPPAAPADHEAPAANGEPPAPSGDARP